ncbi:MBL fold metallo-hydrolase [Herbidospora galbida]|uniref:MBL fold metallo-hydrolase n=1 Tax=Herbidospora galbida TaxID=2575442 RepID=A0A4U3MJJ4_9ACTN|nr:MBL fold metallo-hydrolase [Herbidospora galbida]TKK88624.1 MBL fold metallo-hydrolase [Herbidospora galbida]
MKLTKLGHACWRFEKDGRAFVLDPGSFSGTGLLDGAEAVLITHEHVDHLDANLIKSASPDLEVWTCNGVTNALGEVPVKIQTVREGDVFEVAGFSVRVIGEWHAPTIPDAPIIQNIGFLIDDRVFYPGDALTDPGVAVETLLAPSNAPWLRVWDFIEYLRAVRPDHAFSTHDGLVNEIGQGMIDNFMAVEGKKQKADMRRLKPGESMEFA